MDGCCDGTAADGELGELKATLVLARPPSSDHGPPLYAQTESFNIRKIQTDHARFLKHFLYLKKKMLKSTYAPPPPLPPGWTEHRAPSGLHRADRIGSTCSDER